MTDGARLAEGARAALAHHWHPVCVEDELPGPVGVRLLGRDLAVARLGESGNTTVAAFDDRCPHRSTRRNADTGHVYGVPASTFIAGSSNAGQAGTLVSTEPSSRTHTSP